jgi:hypothetical protein
MSSAYRTHGGDVECKLGLWECQKESDYYEGPEINFFTQKRMRWTGFTRMRLRIGASGGLL